MAGTATILIIDDDPDYRASTRALLEGEGYRVIEAASGMEGLTAVRESRPGLIVLDVVMSHLAEGYSVNQALKCSKEYEDLRDIPVLMASSVEADPDSLFSWIADARAITPDAYFTKPLDIPRFLKSVRSMLEDSGS